MKQKHDVLEQILITFSKVEIKNYVCSCFGDTDDHIYIICSNKADTNPLSVESFIVKKDIFFKIDVPAKFQDQIPLLKEGKYSKLSLSFKNYLEDNNKVFKKIYKKEDGQNKLVIDVRAMVLYPDDERFVNYFNEFITKVLYEDQEPDESLLVKKGMELAPPPDEKHFLKYHLPQKQREMNDAFKKSLKNEIMRELNDVKDDLKRLERKLQRLK